jgi:phage terminase large subunit
MALVQVTITPDKQLIIKELYYQREQLISDLIQWINENGFNTRDNIIIADAASPEKIAELRKAGLRIKPARKGKSSIRKGIDTVKQYSIKVYSSDDYNSNNVLNELRKYKWKEDKEGNSLEEPIDMFNHALDAVRYAADYLHRKRGGFKIL